VLELRAAAAATAVSSTGSVRALLTAAGRLPDDADLQALPALGHAVRGRAYHARGTACS
jgi:hypothetical protein